MDENNQSFRALEAENPRREEEADEDDEFSEDDDGEGEHGQISMLEEKTIAAELRSTESETLHAASSVQLVQSDLQSNFGASSYLLSEVPVEYTLQPLESAEFKVGVANQEASVSVTLPAAQNPTQNQLQSPRCPNSLKLSPTSVTQSISSTSSPPLPKQRLSPVVNCNTICIAEVDKHDSFEAKPVSAAIARTPSTDGYNWRKYGQKQVKSPQGSRSYYKCTYSDCYAKKIECGDHSNRVIEIIYKSRHNHDPPRKINCTSENRLTSSAAPLVQCNNALHPGIGLNDSDSSTSPKEPVQELPSIPEANQLKSCGSDETAEVNIKEEHLDEPESKRRVKKSSSVYSGSPFKSAKKPKFVVHAAGDVGISGDGYRWRKYGQKMVKGNPHPRNYYRCTSAGCPVRKHIEMAVDSTSAVIITYKGIHDHDMPVPKKRHGPPSAPLVAAAAPASMNNLQFKKSEALQNQISATQWSVDTEGELTGEALDIGEEKSMESARTLLSIGFEIKPC